MEWIEQTVFHPQTSEIQKDGRVRKWAYIEEEGKYLRVILLEDDETVHNAFLDRNHKKTES
jgi:uncharacterized membrane protein